MICRKCGRENSDNAHICVYCGISLDPLLPKEPMAPDEPILNELSSGGSLSAAMISSIKAESAASASFSTAASASSGAPASASAPDAARMAAPAVAAKAGSARLGAEKPSAFKAAKADETAAAYARPSSRQEPYIRRPVPMYKARPQAAADEQGEALETTTTSPKTRRKVIFGTVLVFVAIFFANMYDQCSGMFDDNNALDNQTSYFTPPAPGTDPAFEIMMKKYSSDSSSGADEAPQTPAIASSGENAAEEISNPQVILDEPEIKITISLGSGNDFFSFYDTACLIENRTNMNVYIVFESVSAIGFDGRAYAANFFPADINDEGALAFKPGATMAYLSLDKASVTGDITDFIGTILVYDHDTKVDIGRYTIVIAEL